MKNEQLTTTNEKAQPPFRFFIVRCSFFILHFLFVFVFASSTIAQDLTEFRSPQGKYAIRLPSKPSEGKVGPITMNSWHSVEGSYIINTMSAKLPDGPNEKLLAEMTDASAKAMKCTIKERRPLKLGPVIGQEITGTFEPEKNQTGPSGHARLRVYLANDRIVQVLAQGTEEFLLSPRTKQVFDSFTLEP